jgi:hypothetical protein
MVKEESGNDNSWRHMSGGMLKRINVSGNRRSHIFAAMKAGYGLICQRAKRMNKR